MFRQELPKRLRGIDQKKHFAGADPKQVYYPHRLNFYNTPPTAEVTLDEFQQWAIDRLRILGKIETCLYHNKSPAELADIVLAFANKHVPLGANSSQSKTLQQERRKDHYSHYILRLAFARSEELRRRFSHAETVLFKLRLTEGDSREGKEFIESLGFDWETVSDEEKRGLREQLIAATGTRSIDAGFFKVDWERVYDLVDQRKTFLKGGKAYVSVSQQSSLLLAEFTSRLDKALEITARALPRLDEDDRLIPILKHLSLDFTAPEYNTPMTATTLNGAAPTAAVVDDLVQYFPMCMRQLHTTLRREKKLLHNGRLQYNLFLKGVGLSVDEALIFWRRSFSRIDDDRFAKEYRYNIRHAYGLEGTRRNYKPMSCQQILMERRPAANQVHGCPYREISVDNLVMALGTMGVSDREVIRGVRADVEAKKYHVACTRVFEHSHAKEIRRERDSGVMGAARFSDNIIHPNEYFTRSFSLKNPGSVEGVGGGQATGTDVTM